MNRDILLESIVSIAHEAGLSILSFYHQPIQVMEKSDHSPLTLADEAAHRVIVQQLEKLTPDIPIISEEGDIPNWSIRQKWSRFWLVDPLDGTKEFIKKNGEFTVNIALIERGKPTISVIHAPALSKTWLANGDCAWRETALGRENIRALSSSIPIVVSSRSHPSPELAAYLLALGDHKTLTMGSSLKFCLIAEGRAQYYPRFGPTMMWDTAAGQCIVESAGGKVSLSSGDALSYDREKLINSSFFCSL